uniref:Zinc finger protein 850-like n=1 Tax=Stegastes partitus TaxID=144197 RepID=A0A3B4ZHF2_9TELE
MEAAQINTTRAFYSRITGSSEELTCLTRAVSYNRANLLTVDDCFDFFVGPRGKQQKLEVPVRECGNALQQGGLDGQKSLARTPGAGRGDSVSPGRAEDSAGPSAPDTAVEPSGDRPHHCLECGKTFRLISSLKKHIRIHTGEKPYPCGVCGRRFRESGALKTHLRIHTGEKPYSCSECGNCFRHLDGLRKHRRTHTGEKPYVCAICGKRLSRLQHLKHHQLIHTGERPCCCPFCNRSFKEPAALRKHIRTVEDILVWRYRIHAFICLTKTSRII